ncbi:MAG: MBL fold metallo-hydrolase [Spirochaetes bacterium]|jgi:7,8-dihydropterin-6-yl-methyl-4-(beta-D-ribofuranosyl)aminobenzene 5'-phosphate synthase|nr:MBL fold metallo-hydrolase [Spirochaetota bacterium]
MRITVVIDNCTYRDGLSAEHGLCYLLEGEKKVLLDTGRSNHLLKNLRELELQLSTLDGIVLSHCHFDHTGGLEHLLKAISADDLVSTPVIASMNVFREAFSSSTGAQRSVGIPLPMLEYEKIGARFKLIDEPEKMGDVVVVPLGKKIPGASHNQNLFVRYNSDYVPDAFLDEMVLLIAGEYGYSVVTSCAHKGVGAILEYLSSEFSIREFHTVMGGFHLKGATVDQLSSCATALNHFNVSRVICGHCTGVDGFHELKSRVSGECVYASAGSVYSI